MRHILTVLLPIFLIGCSGTDGEPERTPERKSEREVRVQALIKQLADESHENRQAAYAELRDTFVRKRDVPELTKEIFQNDNPEVHMSLQKLLTFMERRWRLPDKGWTTDIDEWIRRYKKEFQDLGCQATVGIGQDNRVRLAVRIRPEKWTEVIDLILIIEPEMLALRGSLTNITFLGTLANLEELDLSNTNVTDLTPLRGMAKLWELNISNTGVTALTPLKGLSSLRILHLKNTGVADLTPLKGMPNLWRLYLQNTKVTDLTPLKGLRYLTWLYLDN